NPRAAPQRPSASAAALASLSTFTGTLYFALISEAREKLRQQGTFGGFSTTPDFGSSGPGAQSPMLPISGPADIIESIAPMTASRPACAVPLATIGLRPCARILPSLSTIPTAILVPPMSTPRIGGLMALPPAAHWKTSPQPF